MGIKTKEQLKRLKDKARQRPKRNKHKKPSFDPVMQLKDYKPKDATPKSPPDSRRGLKEVKTRRLNLIDEVSLVITTQMCHTCDDVH